MKIMTLDLGGSSIKYALLDEERRKLDSGKVPAPLSGLDEFYDTIVSLVPEDADGLAMSMPGAIDSENGIAITGGSYQFIHEEPIVKTLQDKLGIPVWAGNDAKCAALAEVGYGALQDVSDAFCIILGTGIGGCVILDHQVRLGRHFSAGEASFIVANNGYPLQFTHLWCMVNGAAGLLGFAQKYLDTQDKLSGEQIFDMANHGDEKVLAALDEFCYNVANQIFNTQALLDMEKVAIGGGISAQPLLLEKINEQYLGLFEAIKVAPFPPIPIVACEFRNDANLFGAYYSLVEKEKKHEFSK